MALIEFKNLPDTSTPLTAENLNNNFKELQGGRLLAVGYLQNTTSNSTSVANNQDFTFADNIVPNKVAQIKNYVDGLITYESGTLKIHSQGIVGYVRAKVYFTGESGNGCVGLWFKQNYNQIPTGVTALQSGTLAIMGVTNGGYGGNSAEYQFYIETNDNAEFFVNPQAAPYGGSFTPCAGGTKCQLIVEVYSK